MLYEKHERDNITHEPGQSSEVDDEWLDCDLLNRSGAQPWWQRQFTQPLARDCTLVLAVDERVTSFGLFYAACDAVGVPPFSSEVIDGDTEPTVIEFALHLEDDKKMPDADFFSTAGWYTTPFDTMTPEAESRQFTGLDKDNRRYVAQVTPSTRDMMDWEQDLAQSLAAMPLNPNYVPRTLTSYPGYEFRFPRTADRYGPGDMRVRERAGLENQLLKCYGMESLVEAYMLGGDDPRAYLKARSTDPAVPAVTAKHYHEGHLYKVVAKDRNSVLQCMSSKDKDEATAWAEPYDVNAAEARSPHLS